MACNSIKERTLIGGRLACRKNRTFLCKLLFYYYYLLLPCHKVAPQKILSYVAIAPKAQVIISKGVVFKYRKSEGREWAKPLHTVAIWTFPFHKISGFVRVILKGNFKQLNRPKVSIFWSKNSDLLFSFSFYFLQNLSNPLLFAHCCCYSKELTCLNCVLMLKSQFRYVNSLK